MLELLSYQKETVERILHTRKFLIAHDMGLGKTATAITAMREAGIQNAIIVCPSIAKSTWVSELKLWWRDHPEFKVLKNQRDAFEPDKINIVSYGCVSSIVPHNHYDAIVLDEIHYIKNPKSKRTRAVYALRRRVRFDGLVLGLSGTPIDDRPEDLWQQFDFLYPKQFGSRWEFCAKYCNHVANRYTISGVTFKGLNLSAAPALRAVLAPISHRVAASEVADLLPPLIVRRLHTSRKARIPKALTEQVFLKQTEKYQATKVRHAMEWIKDQHEAGNKHLVLLTYLRSTAEAIRMKVASDIHQAPVIKITGEIPADQRNSMIIKARKQYTRSIVVATMSSVGVSINALATYNYVLFVELAWHCGTVLQAIRRFGRLNSTEKSIVDLLLLKGGIEEVLIDTLQEKISDIVSIFGAKGTESLLDEALTETCSEKEWQQKVLDVATGFVED